MKLEYALLEASNYTETYNKSSIVILEDNEGEDDYYWYKDIDVDIEGFKLGSYEAAYYKVFEAIEPDYCKTCEGEGRLVKIVSKLYSGNYIPDEVYYDCPDCSYRADGDE